MVELANVETCGNMALQQPLAESPGVHLSSGGGVVFSSPLGRAGVGNAELVEDLLGLGLGQVKAGFADGTGEGRVVHFCVSLAVEAPETQIIRAGRAIAQVCQISAKISKWSRGR